MKEIKTTLFELFSYIQNYIKEYMFNEENVSILIDAYNKMLEDKLDADIKQDYIYNIDNDEDFKLAINNGVSIQQLKSFIKDDKYHYFQYNEWLGESCLIALTDEVLFDVLNRHLDGIINCVFKYPNEKVFQPLYNKFVVDNLVDI